jgi:hypothetical protein
VSGPVEKLVTRALGMGININACSDPKKAAELVDIVHEARMIDGNEGRCGHFLYEDDPGAHVVRTKRCVRERGHESEALRAARKVVTIAREVELDDDALAEALRAYDVADAASGHVS